MAEDVTFTFKTDNDITYTATGTSGGGAACTVSKSNVILNGTNAYTDATKSLSVYANSTLTITAPGNITQIDLEYNGKVYPFDEAVGDGTAGSKFAASGAHPATYSPANPASSVTLTNPNGGKSELLSLKVTYTGGTVVNVTGVNLNQTTATMTVGEKLTLTATVAPDNATNKSVAWSSSDAGKATVSNGVVTAKGAGEVTITATTADGNLTATCVITVNAKQAPEGSVFFESFDGFNGVGGNDGIWSNISTNPALGTFDNEGWTVEGSVLSGAQCASIRKSTEETGGTTIKSGLVTPAIGVAGNGHIQFDAEAWGGDTKDFYVQIVDGGTFVESSAVSLTENATVAKVELAKSQAEFTTYDLSFTGLTADSKFRFYMAAGKRGFLDEVAVWVTPLATDEVALSAAGYATYSSAYPFSVEGADAYKAEVSGMNVTFTKITGNIPAGEGVLLGGEASATVTITEATAAAAIEGNDMKATTTATESCVAKPTNGTVYVLNASANEFQKYTGTEFTANKAYLHVEEAAAPAVLHITFAEDEVTAVENVETADAVKFIENGVLYIQKNGRVYNAMGQIVK